MFVASFVSCTLNDYSSDLSADSQSLINPDWPVLHDTLRFDCSLSTKTTDEIPQYLEQIVKRSAAICPSHITGGIAPAGTESSQSGPVCYIPAREAVSGHQQKKASILEPGRAMGLPPRIREGSSFQPSLCASLGSIGLSTSRNGKNDKAITSSIRFVRFAVG